MSEVFSDAIVKIIGYGQAVRPQTNDVPLDPLVRHRVSQIFDFTDTLAPDWSKLDLAAAGEWAKLRIAQEFPFLLPDALDALDALAWSCTFSWK